VAVSAGWPSANEPTAHQDLGIIAMEHINALERALAPRGLTNAELRPDYPKITPRGSSQGWGLFLTRSGDMLRGLYVRHVAT
jgi:hypothetical protein